MLKAWCGERRRCWSRRYSPRSSSRSRRVAASSASYETACGVCVCESEGACTLPLRQQQLLHAGIGQNARKVVEASQTAIEAAKCVPRSYCVYKAHIGSSARLVGIEVAD
eukprot:183512-Pleurochrysis_carterae.AAC.10